MTQQYSKAQMAAFKAAMRDPDIGGAIGDLAALGVEADRITKAGAMTPATESSLDRRADEAAGRGREGLRRFFGG
jgi:hypothetical protein